MNPIVRSFIVLLLVSLTVACAGGPNAIDLDSLRTVRETIHPAPGEWKREEGALVNVIPAGASPQEIAQSINGQGVSVGLLEGFEATNLIIEAEVSYQSHGAPGLVFHVQEDERVVHRMLMVVLNSDGVHLWEFADESWEPIGRHFVPVAADTPHVLRAEVRGDEMAFYLNGDRVLSGTYTYARGGAGISGRAGPCRFYALRAESLD